MTDDASRLFNLYETSFLTHMSVAYPQTHGPWHISPLPPELLSCVIFTLHRNPCGMEIIRMIDIGGCIGSGMTYVPPCWSILLSNIHPSLTSN